MEIKIELTRQTGALLSLALEKQIAKSARERDLFESDGVSNLARLAGEDVKWLRATHERLCETMWPPDPELVDFHEPPPPPGHEDLIEDADGYANYTRAYPDNDTNESRLELEEEARAAELAAGWDPSP